MSEDTNMSSGGFSPNTQELEMLLEAYFVQIEGTMNNLSILREYVDDTEDYINIMLDDKQNQLLQFGVVLTAATMAIVAAGFLSINVRIPLYNTSNKQFCEAFAGLVASAIGLAVAFYLWFRKSGLLQ